VMAITRKNAMEGEKRMAMGRASYAKDVDARMAQLQGRSTSKLEPDANRGPASPLGGSKKGKR
jgi:hypothetical protein